MLEMCTVCVAHVHTDGSDDEEGVNQMYTSRIPRSFLQLTVSLVSA